MLAAILCNLGTPTPPPVVQAFFAQGGGPFTRQSQDDDDERVAKEAREALPGPKAQKAEQALLLAVQAVRESKPEPVNARRVYERVFLKLRGELRGEVSQIIGQRIELERIRELWRAEIRKRIAEEDEEIAVVLLSI